jgi:hypothetical protein
VSAFVSDRYQMIVNTYGSDTLGGVVAVLGAVVLGLNRGLREVGLLI